MSDFMKRVRDEGRGGEQPQTMNGAAVEVLQDLTGKQIVSGESLQIGRGVRVTDVGLEGFASSFEDWEQIGRALKRIESGLQFAVGDWINQGIRWGDRYKVAAAALGFEEQTLRVYSYVSQNVPLLIRINKLSFGHHRLVAPFDDAHQRLWLARAVSGDGGKPWSFARMKVEIEGRPAIDWYSDVAIRRLDGLWKALRAATEEERHELAAELRRRADWLEGKR